MIFHARVAPSALFASELHPEKLSVSTEGNKLARAAAGLEQMGVLLTQVPICYGSGFTTIRIRIYGSKVVLFRARREHVWVNL